MKNNRNFQNMEIGRSLWTFTKKNPLVMKLFIFYLFCSISMLQAVESYAQNARLSLNVEEETVANILQQIENASDFDFFYNNSHVDLDCRVSITAQNSDIFTILNEVFEGTGVHYTVLDKKIILSTELAISTQEVQQHDNIVKGKVTDVNGEPVIGATIKEAGTENGAITDINGNFSITVQPNALLEISFIGYKTEIQKAITGKTLAITLKEDNEILDEVVVVGYGTQKKVNLTGSVSTINSKSITNRAISNVSQGLQGLAPGMTVTNAGGQPGMDTGKILIRGVGTFNIAEPMVLIDGVEGNMNILDPQDIESISVLKDASSAAIYGSKAANGVILITTKRGKTGTPQITYNGLFGWSSPSDLMKRTSSAELAQLTNEAEYWGALSEGATPEQAALRKPYSDEDIKLFMDGTDPYGHPNTDWYDLFYIGSGFMNKHNISLDGGSEWVNYRTSIGYTKQEGIVKNASNRQFNIRTNLDIKLTNKLISKINIDFTNTLMKEPTNPISWNNGKSEQTYRQVNRISPMVPYKNEDGTYGTISDGNPIAFQDLGSTGDTENDYITTFIEFAYNFFDGLSLKANGSYLLNNEEYTLYRKDIQYNPSKYDGPIRLTKKHAKNIRKQGDILLSYDKINFNNHTINALVGAHSEVFEYRETQAYRQNFPSTDITDLNGGSLEGMTNSGYTRELAMNSIFGRLKYNYHDKYLVEGNIRGDASSRFAPQHRWGWFPSFSAAWRISNEAFMEPYKDILTDMKLRGSWGILGNQEILNDYYPYINTFVVTSKYPFNNKISSGAAQIENKIENISWEKTRTWGVAIDMTLLQDLFVTLEYYNRRTSGILMQVNVPNTYGYPGYWDNVGEMENQGLEVQINYNKKIKDFLLNISGNFAYNRNKVLSLGNIDAQKGTRDIVMVGKEYKAFYGYKSDGLFQSQEEIDNAPKYTMINNDRLLPGDIKLVDITQDGIIDENDKIVLSSENPKYTFAFNIGGKWKNFDINLFFQGAADVSRFFTDEMYGEFNGDSGHPSKLWLQRWTPDNPTNKWPRASKFRTYNMPEVLSTDFWLVNTNYLRLKDIQIGFNLPHEWIKKINIKNARIYYDGANLLTFKKCPQGIDPEAPAGWGAYYPHIKTHSLGITVTL